MSAQENNLVLLRLPHDFVGQLLDGLDVLIGDWDSTYRYESFGVCDDDRSIRECSSAEEAREICKYYRRIKRQIERQLEAGRKTR